MKTSNLVFKRHPFDPSGTIASHTFSNGYGVSVITGEFAYSTEDSPYEVAILYNDEIVYDTELTGDVIGHNTEEDLDIILQQVEAFPPRSQ